MSGGVWAVDKFYSAKTGKWSVRDTSVASFVNRVLANMAEQVKIPSNIPSGDYLMRGEIIALHSAGSYPGAQLYMGCVQIRVTGGSGSVPASTVRFPGAYKSTDPGITVNIYSGIQTYTIPGRKYSLQLVLKVMKMVLTVLL